MLNYDALMGLEPVVSESSYTQRDTMLYALGVGAAQTAPTDPAELRLVFEQNLVVLPTMAVTMAYPGPWITDPKFGVNYAKLLHGEQMLTIHQPLPTAGRISSRLTVDGVFDKGEGKGAVVYTSRELHNADTGVHLASLKQSVFLRANGGFGGTSDGAPKPYPNAEGASDIEVEVATRTDQALLYRLSGDYNPLHADPELAHKAGFARPILHGLCTYGITGRAVIKALCGGDPIRLRRLDVRFSSPVLPGDTLQVSIWRQGEGKAALRVQAIERNLTVLQNGYVEYD